MIIKTILITGVAGGIGKELVYFLASQKKYNLILVSRDMNALQKIKTELNEKYKEIDIEIFKVDLVIEKEVNHLFELLTVNNKVVDVLINNAATPGPVGDIIDTKLNDIKYAFDVNVFAVYHLIQKSIVMMKQKRKGKIINICGAGVGWNATSIQKSTYVSTKFALYGLTEALSRECKNDNIDINCISPGSYTTQLSNTLRGEDNVPLKSEFNNVAEKLGPLIDFLITKNADGISGKIFSANFDSAEVLLKNRCEIIDSADYTIRKIDNINFRRI